MTFANSVLNLLERIDAGDITVDLIGVDKCCLAEYVASNGWSFRIFDDCGEWDYVNSVKSPDSIWVDLWKLPEAEGHAVLFFRPSNLQAWRWGGISPAGYKTSGRT